jgi:putative NADH-flavin reductase
MSYQRRIAIFGAAGRVGRLLVEYTLADGHKVVAFVHQHHTLPESPELTIVQGNVYSSSDVKQALEQADIVLSALSSWGTPKKDVLSAAMTTIIPAMQELGISRIISLTGAEARASGDSYSLIHRLAHAGIGLVGGKVLHDGEQHIELLERSGLNWTVIRSPIMRSGDSRAYELTTRRPLPWALINRQAVARAMVDAIAQDGTKATYIHHSHE